MYCKACRNILTIDGEKLNKEDGLSLCIGCRELKQHADTFKDRVLGDALKKEE